MKLFTASQMPGCRRSQLPAGPRVQVKLLSDCRRWFRLSDIAWLFIVWASCWAAVAGREGGFCVSVWDAKLWFLLSVPGTHLCRWLDGSFPSAAVWDLQRITFPQACFQLYAGLASFFRGGKKAFLPGGCYTAVLFCWCPQFCECP